MKLLNLLIVINIRLNLSLHINSSTNFESFHSKYHNYEEIKNKLKELSIKYKENTKFIESFGKSYEKRDLFAFKITRRSKKIKNKKYIWYIKFINLLKGLILVYILENG